MRDWIRDWLGINRLASNIYEHVCQNEAALHRLERLLDREAEIRYSSYDELKQMMPRENL